ncbi:MAG: hypothetical protein Q9201_003546 [Fulgogasparrea decipioides]
MSGFEVVGVVLGAAPLIVSALENYKISKRLWTRMRKTALHINELIEALAENQALIEASVDFLFQKIDADDAFLGYNAVDCASRLRRKDTASDIQSFLGMLYKPYEKALLRCERILLGIVNKLDGLVLDTKVPPKSLKEVVDAQVCSNGRYTFVNRIKFSVKKDELDELIADLRDSRRSLEDIARARINTTKDVALPVFSPRAVRLARLFDQIQRHALGLYFGIRAAWADQCHLNHAARFLLNSWSGAISTKRKPRIAFKVAFASSSQSDGMESCKEVGVEILNEDDVEEQTTDQACTVRFDNIERKPTFTVIDSICASFLHTAQTKGPLNFCLSPDRLLGYQPTGATCPSTMSTPKVPHDHLSQSDSVTLNDILTNNIRFDPRDRVKIAFLLVSAQLQLHSTPWLPTFWSKDILRFPWIKDPQTSEILVIYSCPFLQRHFSATTTINEQSLQSAKRPLLELGIILLEIWNQQTFTEYASSVGKKIDEGYRSRYEIAKQWLDDTEQQLLPPYASVLSRCIECNVATGSLNYYWHDEILRQSIYEHLLRPLHQLAS